MLSEKWNVTDRKFFLNVSVSLSVHQDDVGTEAGGECRDEPHVLVPREQRGYAAPAAP